MLGIRSRTAGLFTCIDKYTTQCIQVTAIRSRTTDSGTDTVNMNKTSMFDKAWAKVSQCFETCRRLYSASCGSSSKKFTVVVEGNIGSGKTTLLEYFASSNNTEILMEPVSKWRDIRGENALALLYEDPSRWSLALQTYVQLTMLQAHTQKQTKPVKLMERSIYSAKYCFVENLHDSGKMQDIEYIILTRWFEWIIQNQPTDVDLIVYLRTDPKVIHKRIMKRCRKEETTIPLEYLENLHQLHEDWLIKQTKFSLPAPVLVIDGNDDLPEMEKIYEQNRKNILCSYS